MKIFDSRWIGPHGIGRFASELFNRLEGFTGVDLQEKPSAPLDPWRLRMYLRAKKPRLFFSPGYNPPLGAVCPFVFTVHDLNHLVVKENASPLKRCYYEFIVRPALDRAAIVLTGSEFSRRQLCDWARIPEQRTAIVGYGVSGTFRSDGPAHSAGKPYFLHVGNHRPHKNLSRALRAFADSGLQRHMAFLVTGQPSPQLAQEIDELGVKSSVQFLGTVSDEELASLYRGAQALVFVSLYEGFGLPIIEAMACGAPVLTSRAASMPEVAGEAALLADPTDQDAIAAELKRLAQDEALRSTLRARGLERAKLYTWEATTALVKDALDAST